MCCLWRVCITSPTASTAPRLPSTVAGSESGTYVEDQTHFIDHDAAPSPADEQQRFSFIRTKVSGLPRKYVRPPSGYLRALLVRTSQAVAVLYRRLTALLAPLPDLKDLQTTQDVYRQV